ncbi:hypothetical protein BU23DRAFT_550755 [Bimuria novae-zelandiae CBS 107.79]|uniref:Uncharacterized protein n=1 Tax=Bimuria novae-zelandiae CBS 107.79 TaxID=1447943 RepID=A0A6A5VJN4_9PLEO|nr:hypothetical protein BU23DRAFT_550755 [Bimuria novae-zelandiae CBS 107.79]
MSHRYGQADTYRPSTPITRVDTTSRHYDDDNPNNTRLPSRDHHDTPDTAHGLGNREDYDPGRLPQVYDRSIDLLVGRTLRAYQLVVDYERACPTGHRWTPEHIEMIRHAGRNLELDRAAIENMRATLAQGGDAVPINKIRADAEELRRYCLEIQDLINVHEQKPVVHAQAVEIDSYGRPVGITHEGGYERGETSAEPHCDSGTDTPRGRLPGNRGERKYGRRSGKADCWRRNEHGSPR